jgi:hypothetical protein
MLRASIGACCHSLETLVVKVTECVFGGRRSVRPSSESALAAGPRAQSRRCCIAPVIGGTAWQRTGRRRIREPSLRWGVVSWWILCWFVASEYAAHAQHSLTQWAWVIGSLHPSFGLQATSTAWMSPKAPRRRAPLVMIPYNGEIYSYRKRLAAFMLPYSVHRPRTSWHPVESAPRVNTSRYGGNMLDSTWPPRYSPIRCVSDGILHNSTRYNLQQRHSSHTKHHYSPTHHPHPPTNTQHNTT